MKHFLRVEDFSRQQLEELLDLADAFKQTPIQPVLSGKTLVSMFFNPSTRTKVSFDLAMHHLGGHNVGIEPGKSSWGIELEEGVVMDGEAEEHLKEVTKVLCRYADALAVRRFPEFKNWQEEKKDRFIQKMSQWSTKPVINMETITHPCQALAMMKTIRDRFQKQQERKKFVLTWVYHPKGLNTAVANSAGMIASIFGMDITIAHPPGYDLDEGYVSIMKAHCEKNNARFEVVHSMEEAFAGADFVYAKSWGALSQYGNFNKTLHDTYQNWIVDGTRMQLTNGAGFSHCLPLRRNIKATDEVMDADYSLVYEEAENRLHVQKAVLKKLLEAT